MILNEIVLYCTDPAASRRWYERLGLPYLRGYADMHWLGAGPVTIMLHPHGERPAGATPQLYLRVDDLDTTFDDLVERGFEPWSHQHEGPLKEPATMSYGAREFELTDPDGHVWGFREA